MLSKAVQEYEPPPPGRSEKSTVLKNPGTTIESMLKGRGQSSQKSLGGFTKYKNQASTSQIGVLSSGIGGKLAPASRGPNVLKRISSEMRGFTATLNKADSFQNSTPQFSDLTQEAARPEDSITSYTLNATGQTAILGWDPDDFEDDSDIDFDTEYPQALPPLKTTREPLQSLVANLSQTGVTNSPVQDESTRTQAQPTSALSWSLSPSSHKDMPPRAEALRQEGKTAKLAAQLLSSESSIDANPRPAKRRTMPWLQKEAEERGMQERARQDQAASEEYTPIPKDNTLPWNTTKHGLKQQQKALKNARKTAKDGELSVADIRDVITGHHQGKVAPLCLSDEQKNVLNLVTQKKKSIFFTGSAGTGKSVLMRSIIDDLKKLYSKEPDRVAITASTGLAACNIGGVTLHSFSGIGLGKESTEELVKKILRNQKARNRWHRTKVLIIDEISMVDGELFDKLEAIARLVRKNGRTFGGIQLVITGDFFQLPPVPDFGKSREVKFAFDASSWSTAIDHTIGLTKVFRQKDPVFANMLNEMRLGRITDETVKAFRRLERPITFQDSLDSTELFPTRNEVDNANAFKMRDLVGGEHNFKADDSGTMKDIAARTKLLSNCMAPQSLTLKKGAQVMLIKNLDDGLVNGSQGRVIAFMSEKTFEYYDHHSEPTKLDEDDPLDTGMTFRQASKKLKSMVYKDVAGDTSKEYPVVRFPLADGSSRDLLCQPEDWKVELPNGEVQAQRRQIPLILAWALSIHKAQGQTLDRVTVDLRKVFEKGQAYVALSRATSQEGLQVKGFDKKKVMAHPRVGEFYNSLYSVNEALKYPKVADVSVTKMASHYRDNLDQEDADYKSAEIDDDEEEAMAAYG